VISFVYSILADFSFVNVLVVEACVENWVRFAISTFRAAPPFPPKDFFLKGELQQKRPGGGGRN
jgi:hypothetical protein